MCNEVVGRSGAQKGYRQKVYGTNLWRHSLWNPGRWHVTHRFGAISVQSKKSTTPISVNHVTKKTRSTFLRFNVFERFWNSLSVFSPCFLIVSVGQTLRPLQNAKVVFVGAYTCANILRSDIVNLWRSAPGFGFCRGRKLVQQEKENNKNGVGGLDFPRLWFCRAPRPTF
jgi:hypothetical protein